MPEDEDIGREHEAQQDTEPSEDEDVEGQRVKYIRDADEASDVEAHRVKYIRDADE
jgi:hypothetical protein